MKKILYLLLPVLLSGLSISAQTVYKNQVRIENTSITRNKSKQLIISMDVIMQPTMKISSNRAAILTPLLEGEGQQKLLSPIVVYGRKRVLVNERNNTVPKGAYAIVRRKRKTEQRVNYLIQLPFEKWMQHANLTMDVDLCGCRNQVEANTLDPITTLNITPPQIHPQVAYIVPQKETVKNRSIEGKAYLDFPVNQTVIRPDYRRNQVELAKIHATIDTIRNDKNTSITHISIKGYASPEGKYAANARLAQGRAVSLMSYVSKYYNFSEGLIDVESTPEDWEGFRRFIVSSSIDNKEGILKIMDEEKTDYDLKEAKIRKLIGAERYKHILKECYPTLRHSDYTVSYTIRPFDNEEVKELIYTHPKLLSLQEIFNAAQSYEPGSDRFKSTFMIAKKIFPDNETASFNVVAMDIQEGGDLTAAKDYLLKADQMQGATLNNLGVIALIENDLTAAADYLKRAQKTGCKEADSNLEELNKLLEFQ